MNVLSLINEYSKKNKQSWLQYYNYFFLLLEVYRQVNCKNKSNVLWTTRNIRDKVELGNKPRFELVNL